MSSPWQSQLGRHAVGRAWLIGLGLWLATPFAWAGGVDQLRAFFEQVKGARGHFQQSVVGASGQSAGKVRNASGSFAFQRPGKLRWEYEKPYRQLLVANGETLWVYDEDLAQVTVKRAGGVLGMTPAALLAGQNLDKHFTLVDAGQEDGLLLVDALPVNKEGAFERVRIAFEGGLPRRMEIRDNFGQTTILLFTRFETVVRLDAGLFRFQPPAGIDIIGE